MLISYRLHLQWVLFVSVFFGVLIAGSLCVNSPLHDPPKNSTGTDSGEGVSLGWEDPLEKGMATHYSIHA